MDCYPFYLDDFTVLLIIKCNQPPVLDLSDTHYSKPIAAFLKPKILLTVPSKKVE